MFKLFNRKLNKKGFTLAELLVVIAILAILIAIAIPVFSGMVADANLRVNQANVHSTKSAAVTKILTNLDKNDDTTAGKQLNAGVKKEGDSPAVAKEKGWIALADVDNAGNITNLRILTCDGTTNKTSTYADGIYVKDIGSTGKADFANLKSGTDNTSQFFVMPKTVDTNCPFATVKPTTKERGKDANRTTYTVQTVITDLDLTAK